MIGQHIGSYKIVRVLGEGGMGEVFEAIHEKLHRRVAIKVLHPHVASAPEMAARFRNGKRLNVLRRKRRRFCASRKSQGTKQPGGQPKAAPHTTW